MYYLNVAHTGLDEPSLPRWLQRHQTRPIIMVHDLIPITHPQFCRPPEAQKHRRRMLNVLLTAEGIIANSRNTLDELTVFAEAEGLTLPDCVVAWLGVENLPIPIRPKSLGVPYFVIVGTVEGRKNHAMLLRVWQRLATRLGAGAPKLVIVGQRGWEAQHVFEQLDQPGLISEHVLELSRCDDNDLAVWLAGAKALLMPSFAEGFGLPIIEALRLGTRVVASDIPALREVGGTAATYLNPEDDAAWEKHIVCVAQGPNAPCRPEPMPRVPNWPAHFAIIENWLDELPSCAPSARV
jgi:glycosyltransferase involved in cell wall biosynthesis